MFCACISMVKSTELCGLSELVIGRFCMACDTDMTVWMCVTEKCQILVFFHYRVILSTTASIYASR